MNHWLLSLKRYFSAVFFVFWFAEISAQSLPFSTAGKPIDLSLRREVARTIDRGNQWLMDHQNASGFWSDANHPVITSFALLALQRDPEEYHTEIKEPNLEKGYRYLRSCVQHDGGIYRSDKQRRFDTSASMLALLVREHELHDEMIWKARQYLLGFPFKLDGKEALDQRIEELEKVELEDAHVDLRVAMQVLEVLNFTQHIADIRETSEPPLNRETMIRFLEQHQYAVYRQEAGLSAEGYKDRGGFASFPLDHQSSSTLAESGISMNHLSGSSSFAGLLSYLYVGLESSDVRVVEVMGWLDYHFSLKENPGLGQEDLFFYYLVMAKAWTAMQGHLTRPLEEVGDDWRHALALRLMDLQQPDGSWDNKASAGPETDPVMTTSYALMTLEIMYSGL